MEYFKDKQVVKLGQADIDKARKFANDVVDTIDYGDSNQFSTAKIKEDHFVSKLGEEAVKKVFENFGKTVEGPDYEIYTQKEKSWDADLRIDNVDLAVKTQKKSAAQRYGLSWTFQSSSYRKDPILQNLENEVCFVECDDTNDYSCTVYPPYQIKELTFKDPVLPHLKGKKQVVYETDLPNND